jgi:4-hydroxybenzoyl-CoA reductase subunit beta
MEYMPDFHLHRPGDIEEALQIKVQNPGAKFVAGGTDMLVNVRRGIEQPDALIDLSGVRGLNSFTDDHEGLYLGAGLTLKTIAGLEPVQSKYKAVADAARAVAGPTHQAYGTLGGNLCLDTRCLYYNQSEWWRKSNAYCLKERGEICHVAPGGKFCFAAFSGDMAPAMLVFGAEVAIESPARGRRMKLADLYRNDGMDHLTLAADEIVTGIYLSPELGGDASAYEKARVRGSIDFPLAGAAVRLRKKPDGTIEELSIALTGVNPIPQLINGTEAFHGKTLGEAELDAIRDMTRKQAKPMRTTTVAPWYRRRVVGALARRLTADLYTQKIGGDA